jgi:phosphoglycolate phosphatase-like HAD superfamily hydrolase
MQNGSNGSKTGVVAVLFDIDGTLITTGGAGAVAWRKAFDDVYGIPADIGKFTDAGETDPEVGRKTFVNVIGRDPEPAEMARLMARRLHHLPDAIADAPGYRVLPGVPEALARLAERGYLLGLTTGNVEAAAHIKLARAGLNSFFCFGGYGSDATDRTELTRRGLERAANVAGMELSAAACLVVGDTPRDIEAAHGAGAVAVGVATGHFTKDDLFAAGADLIVDTLEEEIVP